MNNSDSLGHQKAEIVKKFGEWTNHNIRLAGETYTIDKEAVTGAEVKLRRVAQTIADLSGQSFENLRVLDLACLEGLYGIEMALQGAKVVAIEGREANVEKARFAKEALSLENIDIVRDDVRNLSAEKYGQFDVVLCLGIFYHLDSPDVFHFMESVAEVCNRLAVIDTHVSAVAEKCYAYKGNSYWGRVYPEHSPDSTLEERAKSLWSSVDNINSFWLTRPSLYNLLGRVGFSSVYECHSPIVKKYEVMRARQEADRSTFVAVKGQPVRLLSSPAINDLPQEDWPEKEALQ